MTDAYGRVPRFVVDRLDTIGLTGLAVYTVLADYCDADRYCRPSLRTLAERCGNASHRTITQALARLISAGCIRRLDDGGRYSWHLPMTPTSVNATGAVANERVARSDERKCYRSGSGTGAVALPERYQKCYRSGSRSATGAVAPSEQEPESRTKNKNQTLDHSPRRWSDDDQQRFDSFWAAYPRKVSKAKALEWWRRNRPDQPLTDTIVSAVVTQRHSPQWTRDEGQYIPHPATWLNGRRWEDEGVYRGLYKPRNNGLIADGPTLEELSEQLHRMMEET